MNMVGNLGDRTSGRSCRAACSLTPCNSMPRGWEFPICNSSLAEKAVGLLPGYHANFYIFAGVFVVGTLACCKSIPRGRSRKSDRSIE